MIISKWRCLNSVIVSQNCTVWLFTHLASECMRQWPSGGDVLTSYRDQKVPSFNAGFIVSIKFSPKRSSWVTLESTVVLHTAVIGCVWHVSRSHPVKAVDAHIEISVMTSVSATLETESLRQWAGTFVSYPYSDLIERILWRIWSAYFAVPLSLKWSLSLL